MRTIKLWYVKEDQVMEVKVEMKAQITLRMKLIYAMTCDKYTICVFVWQAGIQ